MLFALICKDKPNALEVRMQNRPDHLAFLQALDDKLKAGGPLLDDAGSPNGSLVIIEASDQAAAREIAGRDPYAKAGLFSSVEITPWNWVLKNPETV